jgi:hypothetical protein
MHNSKPFPVGLAVWRSSVDGREVSILQIILTIKGQVRIDALIIIPIIAIIIIRISSSARLHLDLLALQLGGASKGLEGALKGLSVDSPFSMLPSGIFCG